LFIIILILQVHITKPQASRHESAEIFVVCQYYIAPDKIDPKFFDPNYVFSEVETANKLNIFSSKKQKKPKAEGYPENDYTLYHKMSAKEFIACKDAVAFLRYASEIVIDDDIIDKHEKTTKEVRECCKDIKVLGRKQLKLLMNWYQTLKKEQNKNENEEEKKDENEEQNKDQNEDQTKPAIEELALEEQEDLEDEEMEQMIAETRLEEVREQKRRRKKANKEKQKMIKRLNLKMIHKDDEGPKLEESELFSLSQIQTNEHLNLILDQEPNVVVHSDVDSDDEQVKRPKKVYYDKDTTCLSSSGVYYKSKDSDDSEVVTSDDEDDDDANSIKSGLGIYFSDI